MGKILQQNINWVYLDDIIILILFYLNTYLHVLIIFGNNQKT